MRNRYCDKEMGEEIGWLVSPFLSGFHYGCLATGDAKWIDLLIDWSDAVVKRGVKEPDGKYCVWNYWDRGGPRGIIVNRRFIHKSLDLEVPSATIGGPSTSLGPP